MSLLSCYYDDWKDRFGEDPIAEVDHADYSESYEMDMMHVFQLPSGKYVTVIERGCSCYEHSEADVDIHPDRASATSAFYKYKRDHGMAPSNLDIIEERYEEEQNGKRE